MSESTGLWNNFKTSFFHDAELGFSLDISRVKLAEGFFQNMKARADQALTSMTELEKGGIANPDEKRMVGHYWLRNPGIAPSPEIKTEVEQTLSRMKSFAAQVHGGKVLSPSGEKYESVLVVGIGGSALGPQFVTRALNSASDPLKAYFFDNTDPDGMAMALSAIPSLARTLCIVISKSGGTKETRNGMLVAKHAWEKAGLKFEAQAIAVTSDGSELDKYAVANKWLERFPMWDWVGGRTSELSAVGLLAAALQGFNIDRMLEGARDMDEITRNKDLKRNPALLMASAWYALGDGKGSKDMVVLPYNDRLELFSRYLQQLVMESLGKEHDLQGKVVNQGIAVYGNKGSTDQHAYVQQLRDGLLNFFVVFIQVLKDSSEKTALSAKGGATPQGFNASTFEVEPGITSGDYLSGFYQGTRRALYEKGRQSITITLDEVNEYSVGALIALFERAVGFYASFVGINAYHQPGVEAGKKAASEVLTLQKNLVDYLTKQSGGQTVEEIAQGLGKSGEAETLFLIARHLGANGKIKIEPGNTIFADRYSRAN